VGPTACITALRAITVQQGHDMCDEVLVSGKYCALQPSLVHDYHLGTEGLYRQWMLQTSCASMIPRCAEGVCASEDVQTILLYSLSTLLYSGLE
jgi:hypothetical protein